MKMCAEEWGTRVELAAAYRLIAKLGWDDRIFSHMSAKIPGRKDQFLLNPLGLLFQEVTASSLVKVDLDGKLLDPASADYLISAFTIHSALHQARPDVGCIIHLHTIAGTAVSIQSEGLMPISQNAIGLLPRLSYHDYEGIVIDADEKESLIKDLGENDLMIMRNHGTLACSPSIGAAFELMYRLEIACQVQISALSSGRPIIIPGDSVRSKVVQQVKTGSAVIPGPDPLSVIFKARCRILDKEASDYRK